ncbi:MAG: protein kinase [Candidatus Eisenbacteria bacterium]
MDPPALPVRDQLAALLGARFEVRGEIGGGGFGQVFEVFDTKLESLVAAKVLRPEFLVHADQRERFLREVRLLAELRHPNIIPILDVFRSDQLIAYLMPRVEGPTLRQRLDSEGPLPLGGAVRILEEVGGALDFAHRRGVIHRDLKPENILLQDGHAVVADFGIARSLAGAEAGSLTETGAVVGTPRYMSPEQMSGQSAVDGRCDLYALALITYEMISGNMAFASTSSDRLLREKLLGTPTPLHVVRPTVPPDLDRAILRGLAATPADRQATVAEFVRECGEALRAQAGETPGVRAQAGAEPAPSPVPQAQRHPWLRWSAAAAVVVAGAALAWFFVLQPRARRPAEALAEGKRAWFVIADVETSPRDETTAASIRSLIQSDFDQSKSLGALTQEEVIAVLHSAVKPESSTISVDLAKEVADRANAKSVLIASYTRASEGGVFSLRAVQAIGDSVLFSISENVPAGQSVLPGVERAVAKARATLEPHAASIASRKSFSTKQGKGVLTADLAAWHLFRMAGEAAARGDTREAGVLYRLATRRDSTFKQAWNGLGVSYGNLGQRDSAVVAFERALRLWPESEPVSMWYLQGNIYSLSGEKEAALRLNERVAREGPGISTQANLAGSLGDVGRFDEAIALTRPLLVPGADHSSGFRSNLADFQLAVGRADSAQAIAEPIENPSLRALCLMNVAAFRRDGPAIDRFANRLLADLDPGDPMQIQARAALAGRLANRGQVQQAWEVLASAVTESKKGGDASQAHLSYSRQAIMQLVYGSALGAAPRNPVPDGSLDAEISEGLQALLDGRPDRARSIATDLEQRFATRPRMLSSAPALLRAWAASLEGRPSEVLKESAVALADQTPERSLMIRRPAANWLRARAFEDLGRADSAAACYSVVLGQTGMWAEELVTKVLIELPVRERLTIAELRRGHAVDARAQRATIRRMVDRPDVIAAAGLAEVDVILGMTPADRTAEGHGQGR